MTIASEAQQVESLLAYLASCAFEWTDTLDPRAKHRSYYRCKLCGGTNEERERYKMERSTVQHKEDCLIAKHGTALFSGAFAQRRREHEAEVIAEAERILGRKLAP
jgi:hypothetical protein